MSDDDDAIIAKFIELADKVEIRHTTNIGKIEEDLMEMYSLSLENKRRREAIIAKFNELDQKKNLSNDITYQEIKKQMLEVDSEIDYVVNVLVEYLCVEKKSCIKTTLWECFKDVIKENLKRNYSKSSKTRNKTKKGMKDGEKDFIANYIKQAQSVFCGYNASHGYVLENLMDQSIEMCFQYLSTQDKMRREAIIAKYIELNRKKKFMIRHDEGQSNVIHINQYIREQILEVDNEINYVVNVLIEYVYLQKDTPYKSTLWDSFGDIIVENLKRNVKTKYMYCENESCKKRTEKTTNNQKYCPECSEANKKEKNRLRQEKYKKKK